MRQFRASKLGSMNIPHMGGFCWSSSQQTSFICAVHHSSHFHSNACLVKITSRSERPEGKSTKNQGTSCCVRCCVGRHCLESSLDEKLRDSAFWKYSKIAKLFGKGGHSQAVTVQSRVATASCVAPIGHLLAPCTSHPLLPGCLPADSHPSLCIGQVQSKKGNHTIWICWKKVTEQNVTSILMAQQPNHSCHVNPQQKLRQEWVWWDTPLSLLTREKLS